MRLFAILCVFLLAFSGSVSAAEQYPPLQILLQSTKTVIGQKFSYPDGPAEITAAIVTMAPGQETGPHIHRVPLFAYVLEGEVTVDYGDAGTRTYRTGDSLIEAFETVHDGKNTGPGRTRLLVVFAGVENMPNTEAVKVQ